MCLNSLPNDWFIADDDWQEEHARLAELDERVRDGFAGGDASSISLPPPADRVPHPSSLPRPSASTLPPPGLEERGGGDLAESLSRLLLGSDPAIAGVGAAEPDRSRFPPMPQAQGPPSGLPPPPHSLLSYQQHQHLLHRGGAPLPQVSASTAWNQIFISGSCKDIFFPVWTYYAYISCCIWLPVIIRIQILSGKKAILIGRLCTMSYSHINRLN